MASLNDLGAMNALLSVVNDGDEGSTDVVIAKYLLSNFNRLDELNIYDVAEGCFTTRQSIRRFCKDVGLDNFQSFKRYLTEEYDQASGYYFARTDIADYPAFLSGSILAMMAEINEASDAFAADFCARIHQARECVFLVSDIYTAACTEFQKQMILSDKMVRVVAKGYRDSGLLNSLDASDLVVVISISGRWAYEVGNAAELAAARVLITTVHDEKLGNAYDDIYYLSRAEQPAAKTVFHQYGIIYLLDLVQRRYRDMYC